jgi:predicted RNA binding protein YcfA (HicA-like mRNA interferase family)
VKGYGKAVRDKLAEAGCLFVRHGRGDHDIWVNPVSGQNLTVPVKIMSRHLANKVLKDAGLPKVF